MPTLENPKHEKFVQELLKGVPAERAYVNAGYNFSGASASALRRNPKVKARLEELQSKTAEKAAVTAASIVEELDAIATAAQKRGQNAAAVAAVMGKAKVLGLIIDRREQGEPGAFDAMEEGELERSAADKAKALGLKVVNG